MIYARIESHNDELLDLTLGKAYAVLSEDGRGFYMKDDVGVGLYCAWSGSHHLNGGDWERIEIPDGGETE